MTDVPPQPPNPAPPPLGSVECPNCGAKLYNVRAAPGEAVRCLNCNVRFTPAGTTDGAPPRVIDTGHQPAVVREPQSAGYWILRIPAVLFAALLLVGMAVVVYFFFREMSRNRLNQFDRLLVFFYIPLIPFLACYAVVVTSALARVEAGVLKAAWRSKLITESLPMSRGSSLPYILPLAVGPVLIFIINLVDMLNREYWQTGPVVAAAAAAAVCFILAFMADDLRQFLWRQRVMAENCARNAGTFLSAQPPVAPLIAVLPSAGLFLIGLAIAMGGIHDTGSGRYGDADSQQLKFVTYALIVVTMAGAVITVFMLGLAFKKCIAAWSHAEAAVQNAPPAGFNVLVWAIRVPIYLFTIVGTIDVLINSRLFGSLPSDDPGLYVVFCISGILGGICWSLTLPRIFAEVRYWRQAQASFWLKRGMLSKMPALSKSLSACVFAPIIMALPLALLFCAAMFQNGRFSRSPGQYLVEGGLLCFLIHFPIIWFALTAREFMLADKMAAQLNVEPQSHPPAP